MVKKRLRSIAGAAGLVVLLTVVVAEPSAPVQREWTIAPVPEAIQQYIDAFNKHDADAVGKTLSEDVSWLSLSGDAISQDGTGRDAVVSWLRGYFKSYPDVQSRMIARPAVLTDTDFSSGRFFTLRESPSWTGKDGAVRRQAAWAVFELGSGGLIRRVWYHAAEKPE